MQRFLVSIPLSEHVAIEDETIVHQIGRVLRAAPGDGIILFDGTTPEERFYRIANISKRSVECEYVETRPSRCEPARRVTIVQAMPNTLEKLEYALQKCVELGVSRFLVFRSDRSQKPLPADPKRDRLMKIAVEATEQCGGCLLPDIRYFDRLADLPLDEARSFALDMGTPAPMSRQDTGDIALLVGPEGGWSDSEREYFDRAGIGRISFGERIMRTETASVAACAIFAAGRDFW
jgi:16S rRNA (uracil1498-N3)-methyltransferase